jgi:BirA family biotin operon repressor/biotin-[acetyl-CoA-carboxylase] ligase
MGSVLVKAGGDVQQLSFVAALALHQALAGCTGQPARFALKWPNDVLLDGAKCSGILLERQGAALVIGIGVNLAHHPAGTERPAISLAAAGLPVPTPAALLVELAPAFTRWRSLWEVQGFAPIRAAWLARTTGIGTRIVARLGSESPEGRFEGIAEDGALLMRLDDGHVRAIHAGEVFAL